MGPRFATAILTASFLIAAAAAQDTMSSGQHESMAGMNMAVSTLPSPHDSSGTAWQPTSVPKYMWMTRRSNWDLMAHGELFLTFNHQGGPRGHGKAESVNYLMTMEHIGLGPARYCCARCFLPSR